MILGEKYFGGFSSLIRVKLTSCESWLVIAVSLFYFSIFFIYHYHHFYCYHQHHLYSAVLPLGIIEVYQPVSSLTAEQSASFKGDFISFLINALYMGGLRKRMVFE